MDALGELIFGLILGAVQGVTEFFPISSSGHLAIIQIFADKMGYGHFLGDKPIAFNVAVHGASLAAIVIVMRDDIKRIILGERRLLLMLLIATVPAGIVGVLLKSHIEKAFGSLNAVGLALIATGLVLILVEWKKPGDRRVSQTGLLDALIIGCGQAVAIMPGLSRSGCTIGAGLLRKLSRDEAVRYSFLMAIPAIGGACCVKLWQVEAYNIMLYYQSCRKEPKGGHDDALAHAEGHGRTDDAHVIFDRLDWQIALEPRGQHSHLVSPRDQSAGHSLGVDGQTTCVRPVVCQDNEYFHSEYRIPSRLV